MATVFDYVSRINKKEGKEPRENLSEFEGLYSQFVIARQFSYFADTVLFANELNIRSTQLHDMSNLMHFDFLNNSVAKGSRFAKWDKPVKIDNIELIMQVYGYTTKQAEEVIDIFSEDDIEQLKLKIYEGGTK